MSSLNGSSKRQVNNEDTGIFALVVDQYSIEKKGTVEKPNEDNIKIELVPTTKALKVMKIIKL